MEAKPATAIDKTMRNTKNWELVGQGKNNIKNRIIIMNTIPTIAGNIKFGDFLFIAKMFQNYVTGFFINTFIYI